MSKPPGERYAVGSDFDGVLHSYTTPWVSAEVIPDPIVPGAIEWLHEIYEDYDVVIYTTRASSPESCRAVESYLRENGLAIPILVTEKKVPALVYVDDRGWRFEGPGTFPTRDQVRKARPWNKR